MKYLFLALAITAEVTATSFMKQTDGCTKLMPSLITVVGYSVSFYFLSLTLKEIPTGIAYAIWSGAGIVLITSIAWVFQGQKLDMPSVIGMALIITGVIFMNVFSKTLGH